jgi:putative FmdB family regulatory protein
MPIFEYICKDCQHHFEIILHGERTAECPACTSRKLEKQLSVFAPATRAAGIDRSSVPAAACGSCGDPRGPGSCSLN